jgi:hypothetical protein
MSKHPTSTGKRYARACSESRITHLTYDFAFELEFGVVLVEDGLGGRQVSRRVQDSRRGLLHGLSALGNLQKQFVGHFEFGDLRDGIDRNAVRCDEQDPVVHRQLPAGLLQMLPQLLFRFLVREFPALVLQLNDLTERLVGRERSIDFGQIVLMLLEDLQKAFHAENLPPLALLQNGKDAAQLIADVGRAALIGRQRTVDHGHQNRPSVVQYHVAVAHGVDRVAHSTAHGR